MMVAALVFTTGGTGCGNKTDQGDTDKGGTGDKTGTATNQPDPSKDPQAGTSPQTTPNPAGKTGDPLAPNPADPPTTVEAKKIFMMQCAACHGFGGKGDGMAAAQLDPKPRNYTDKTWQASVTDEEIKKTIVLGGAATGKSALMPANPAFEKQPEVVDALVRIVRGFAR